MYPLETKNLFLIIAKILSSQNLIQMESYSINILGFTVFIHHNSQMIHPSDSTNQ
jgi:hypothetical protein